MKPKETIRKFDSHRAGLGLQLEAIIIGGSALARLDVVDRQTRDCDVLCPTLPPDVSDADRSFASQVRAGGGQLDDAWLNNGPASLIAQPPWVEYQDADPDWPRHVREVLADLSRKLGHGTS